MLQALYDKWKSKVVTGEERPVTPGLLCLYNSIPALELLNKHIVNKSRIAVHCDVDMDGIGSGYITKRFIGSITSTPQLYFINKEKIHGIQTKHYEFFRNYPIDLLIILDSSSNDIDIIKKFNCDVIVVDHHEIDHTEYSGYTNDGHSFIIVNNMIGNSDNKTLESWIRSKNPLFSENIPEYNADSRMSCGLVVYELYRLYQEAYRTGPILENLMLFQWVGVTLVTDAIQLLTDRNQWYIENTVHSMNTEPNLLAMIRSLNPYAVQLDKSIIGYTLAPTFNRAIRAGATGDALNVAMDYPTYVTSLSQYREKQDWAISTGIENVVENHSYVMRDITNTGIGSNYTGVIAGRLCDDHNKNAVVYTVDNGIASGSFRGRMLNTDYRSCFLDYRDDIFAQGHKGAFGFKVPIEDLPNIMAGLVRVESEVDSRPYLTAGSMPEGLRGIYHIDNMGEFKKCGGLMMLGIGNSKVASDEQIMITVSSSEATLIEIRGKLYLYDIMGLTCKAFKEIQPGMINIYVEYSKSIEFYVK